MLFVRVHEIKTGQMAPQIRDSINNTAIRSELLRNSTRDFLIDASKLIGNPALNRYYRAKINSLLDSDQDDVEYLRKVSTKSTLCIKCGNTREIKYKGRKSLNKSIDRKHCRYLRALLKEYCNRCGNGQVYKLRCQQSIARVLKRNKTRDPHPKVEQPAQKQPQQSQVQAKQKHQPKPSKKQPPKPPPKPQFSSRLRAFDCLLK